MHPPYIWVVVILRRDPELPLTPLILMVGTVDAAVLVVADVAVIIVVPVAVPLGIADTLMVAVIVYALPGVPNELVIGVVAVSARISVGDQSAELIVMVSHEYILLIFQVVLTFVVIRSCHIVCVAAASLCRVDLT